MRFLIYGAGAVGCYLGASLSRAGHEVVLVMRPKAARRVAETGLMLVPVGERRGVPVAPEIVTSLRQGLALGDGGGSYDFLLLTMKLYDVDDALNELLAFLPSDPPPLVTCQNGLGAEEKVAHHYGEDAVTAVSVTMPVSLDALGNIEPEKEGRGVAVADMGQGNRARLLAKTLAEAGVETAVVDNYQEMKWSKLFTNVIGNATAAIANRPPAVLYNYKPIFEVEVRMLEEILAVMKAQNLNLVDLPGAAVKKLVRAMRWLPKMFLQGRLTGMVEDGRGDKRPSFHVDLLAGKGKNEVLYHNGAVHQVGQELQIPTPVNGALTDILLSLVHEEVSWNVYDGKPKELVLAINEHIRQRRGKRE